MKDCLVWWEGQMSFPWTIATRMTMRMATLPMMLTTMRVQSFTKFFHDKLRCFTFKCTAQGMMYASSEQPRAPVKL